MSEFIQEIVLQDRLAEHPAVQAWHKLGAADSTPTRVEILKERKKKKFKNKSAVYRLSMMADDDSSIVAKRCRTPTSVLERDIYENVLPQLPLETLRCYGSVDDDIDDRYSWLFVEDAGGQQFSRSQQSHLTAAAKWLAIMHAATSKIAAIGSLPHRDTGHYFEHLVRANDRITESLRHSFLGIDDRRVLQHLLSQLDRIASQWDGVAASCKAVPRTLAHGDWAPKNLCVRQCASDVHILPFDWETSGRGTPAVDLSWMSTTDLVTYHSVLRESWPDMNYVTLEHLASAGKVFRCVASINWSATSLVRGCLVGWVAYPMSQLRKYAARLESLLVNELRSKS